VKIKTVEVKLLGSIRDAFADGDNALVRIDDGRDVNGDGAVDFRTVGDVTYGFERFRDKSSPRIGPGGIGGPSGDGEFVQTVDAAALGNGLHFIEVRAFRHRTDAGPAVYSSFKKVIRIERP
jgi:alpha-amylase